MASSSQDGHGPAPNMPPAVMEAAKLPPRVTDKYVFFFGYEGSEPANTFQQWYPSPFIDASTRPPRQFRTAEQYMMYHKAVLMGDEEVGDKILRQAATPAEAKTLGRQVRNFQQSVWDKHCDAVVERGNWLKFSQNETCKQALLGTGDRIIVEASPNDKVWGIGFTSEDAEGKEEHWGENKLGQALMRVRARIRNGELALPE